MGPSVEDGVFHHLYESTYWIEFAATKGLLFAVWNHLRRLFLSETIRNKIERGAP